MTRSPFYRTIIVVAIITLALPFSFGSVARFKDYLNAVAVTSLAIALLLLLPGAMLRIFDSTRKVGQGMLVSSAALLLASFTLCSSGIVSFTF